MSPEPSLHIRSNRNGRLWPVSKGTLAAGTVGCAPVEITPFHDACHFQSKIFQDDSDETCSAVAAVYSGPLEATFSIYYDHDLPSSSSPFWTSVDVQTLDLPGNENCNILSTIVCLTTSDALIRVRQPRSAGSTVNLAVSFCFIFGPASLP
ncbi:hypothetical protein FNAPI_11526 [Fusarium napiforme]|uniref:Uncharacterized protein n=1 Tax=Fusarium napiforme TaxID=42672 RepID=A0A8H5IHN1_9HYPO|nr:hypothetical protein FNAPI_11526 [Fusarium napiforme]